MDDLFARTHELLVAKFDRNGLRLLLRGLDVKLSDIASPDKDDSAMLMAVCEWFRRQGRFEELVRAAAAARPLVAELQQLVALLRAPRLPPHLLVVETHRLILVTYERDELEILLRKLSARMNRITTPVVDNSAAALDVVEWFEKRNRLCELIQAAAAGRPAAAEWQLLHTGQCC